MADENALAALRLGNEHWNRWRAERYGVRIDLADIDFVKDIHPPQHLYDLPVYFGFDFSESNLSRISGRNAAFHFCKFDGCDINFSDLCFSQFEGCSFRGASLRVSRLGSSQMTDCDFSSADLSYCSAEDANFSQSRFVDSKLDHMRLVKSDFSHSELVGASVYGISAWDLKLLHTVQRDIRVPVGRTTLTVDNIELAQFLHLILRNSRLRGIIDTISSKVVLILGRFSSERKPGLRALKAAVSRAGFVPVVFDFDGPDSRDVSETVSTLAHLSRFVLADITDPRSVPHELATVVPALPSVPVQPLLLASEEPYGMLSHLQRYPWVLPVLTYTPSTLRGIADAAIAACVATMSAQRTPAAEPGPNAP